MKYFVSAIFLLLSACSLAPQQPEVVRDPAQVWQAQQQHLKQLNHWQAEGRIAYRQGERATSAAFRWQQRGDHYDIYLFGPLGLGTMHLKGTSTQVILFTEDGPSTYDNPNQQLAQLLGWPLPIESLPQWFKGLPTNAPQTIQLNAAGQLASFQQLGWQINFPRYATWQGTHLPYRMSLTRGDITAKLIIKRWKLW